MLLLGTCSGTARRLQWGQVLVGLSGNISIHQVFCFLSRLALGMSEWWGLGWLRQEALSRNPVPENICFCWCFLVG